MARGRSHPPGLTVAEGVSAVALVIALATFCVSVLIIVRSTEQASAHRRPPVQVRADRAPARPAPTTMAGRIVPPPTGSLFWGVSTTGVPRRFGALATVERDVGHTPAVLMWFQDWSGRPSFPVREARLLQSWGIVPMVTWEPWRRASGRSPISLRSIARGAQDDYLRSYARQIRRYGGPLLFRPMHEMDGSWYPWSPAYGNNNAAVYVRAWRHMFRVFRRAGARNATWVWSVNHYSVPHTRANRIEDYYPGSRFVDWVGVSGFNPGPVRLPFRWMSFDEVIRSRYLELLRYGKPILVAEMGAPELGGDKAEWIADAFRSILARYPRLGAVIWFDRRDAGQPQIGDWRVNSSQEALAAFRHALTSRHILSAPAAARRSGRSVSLGDRRSSSVGRAAHS